MSTVLIYPRAMDPAQFYVLVGLLLALGASHLALHLRVSRLEGKLDAAVARLDGRIDALAREMVGRIDTLSSELGGHIDRLEATLTGRIDTLEQKVDGANALHDERLARVLDLRDFDQRMAERP